MIIAMKKVSLLCLKSEQSATLEAVRNLGVIHLIAEKIADSSDRQTVFSRLGQLDRVILFLKNALPPGSAIADGGDTANGRELFLEANERINELEASRKELESFQRQYQILEPWGDFSAELLQKIGESGIHVCFCELLSKEFENFVIPEHTVCREVNRSKREVRFVLIRSGAFEETDLPVVSLPEMSLSELSARMNALREEQERAEKYLETLAGDLPHLISLRNHLAEQADFFSARDGMEEYDQIIALHGFVPLPEVPALEEAAHREGWGLLLEEPGGEDQVPTLIRIPRWLRPVKPLFDFLGISPGYREVDVSGAVLIFFTIYFGIIVGDAGYGLIFLAATVVAWRKLRFDPTKAMLLRLGFILSTATIVWGSLSGNFFGTSLIPGIKLLTDPATKNANMQIFCFLLAMVQMSLGHIWRSLICGKVREIIGNLGWMLLLWGNCILAIKLIALGGTFPTVMYYLYVSGLILILIGGVKWREIGDVFNLPFALIGSFVDVLSYIRLFAVGMAGFYIASSFNKMGVDMGKAFPGAIVIGIGVILLGHTLNIALCLMSVLVHGVRLNTLEFASHIGLSWAGFDYKPFKKITNSEGEKND